MLSDETFVPDRLTISGAEIAKSGTPASCSLCGQNPGVLRFESTTSGREKNGVACGPCICHVLILMTDRLMSDWAAAGA